MDPQKRFQVLFRNNSIVAVRFDAVRCMQHAVRENPARRANPHFAIGHGRHATAPRSPACQPVAHALHVLFPRSSWYFPGRHGAHCALPVPAAA